MTEMYGFIFFHRELNTHRNKINDSLQRLLEQSTKVNKDRKILCGTVMITLGTAMIRKQFYFDCNQQQLITLTKHKMNQRTRIESDFKQKWQKI